MISHNSFSSFQNMGRTLKSLFGSFPKESVYQLYFHSSYPDIDISNSMFRITDNEIINSIKNPKYKPGFIVDKTFIKSNNKLFESRKSESYHKAKKKNKHLVVIRDLLWAMQSWDTEKLNNWIRDIKPNVIFLAAGDAIFPYAITMKLAKRFHIPLVVYFCDDYYFYRDSFKSPLYQLHQVLLRKKIEKIGQNAKNVFYISPSMEKEYRSIVGKRGFTSMTPFQSQIKSDSGSNHEPNKPLIITYTGNVSINRWKTLKYLGQVLSEINHKNTKAIINIYSGSNDSEIIEQLSIDGSMKFIGNINYAEVVKVLKQSDILLHVESFESKDIDRVKHSVSSKIPDYLIANRLILAVGPQEVASISYLKENLAAFTICSLDNLKNGLEDIIENYNQYSYLIENANSLANSNHVEDKNSTLLKKQLQEVIKG